MLGWFLLSFQLLFAYTNMLSHVIKDGRFVELAFKALIILFRFTFFVKRFNRLVLYFYSKFLFFLFGITCAFTNVGSHVRKVGRFVEFAF